MELESCEEILESTACSNNMESSEGGNTPAKENVLTKIKNQRHIKPYGVDITLAFNLDDASNSFDEQTDLRKDKILEGIDILVTHDLDSFSKGWLQAARDSPSLLRPDASDPSQVVIHNNLFTTFMFLVGHAAFVMEPSLLQTTSGLRGYYHPNAEPYDPRITVQQYHVGSEVEIPGKRKLSGLEYDHQFVDASMSRRVSLSNSPYKEGDLSGSDRRMSQTYPEPKRSRSNSFVSSDDDSEDSDTPRSPNAKFTFKVPKNKPKNGAFAKQWLDHYDQLKDFKKAHGHVNVTRTTKGYQHLGSWIATQRRKLRRGKLTEDQFKILSDLGLEWDRSHYFKAAVYRDPSELAAEGLL